MPRRLLALADVCDQQYGAVLASGSRFFVLWLIRGIHNATKTDYWMITMPANAILYAVVILLLRGILSKRRSA